MGLVSLEEEKETRAALSSFEDTPTDQKSPHQKPDQAGTLTSDFQPLEHGEINVCVWATNLWQFVTTAWAKTQDDKWMSPGRSPPMPLSSASPRQGGCGGCCQAVSAQRPSPWQSLSGKCSSSHRRSGGTVGQAVSTDMSQWASYFCEPHTPVSLILLHFTNGEDQNQIRVYFHA